METVARNGKGLFQKFCPFLAFEVIQFNARKNSKIYVGKKNSIFVSAKITDTY